MDWTRRGLAGAALAASMTGAVQAAPKAPAKIKRIAAEEGYSIPELIDAVNAFMAKRGDEEPGFAALLQGSPLPGGPKILDPETRLADMDASGVQTQILLLNSPGVQIFDPPQAIELAKLANDRVAGWMRKWPDRFAPLAAFAPQAPDAAAQELERAVRTLGLKGGIVNSTTRDQYLDDRKFWPIFEAAQALDVPIYLHPREPTRQMLTPYQQAGLQGAIWGYAADTGLHALRLIMAGVFDRFPRLKIVIGHLGEGIPFYLDRIDNRFASMHGAERWKLKRRPSDYFRDHFVVTSSGCNWAPAVRFTQEVLGADKVLYAIDYPFEDGVEATRAADAIPMSAADRAAFFHGNAERVFKL